MQNLHGASAKMAPCPTYGSILGTIFRINLTAGTVGTVHIYGYFHTCKYP